MATTAHPALTPREVEVLVLIARGRSNTEIAGDLFISVATAKTHVARIFMKLDTCNRTHAVIHAYETGLVRARAVPEVESPP